MSSKTGAKITSVRLASSLLGLATVFSIVVSLCPTSSQPAFSKDSDWAEDGVSEFNRSGKKIDEDGDPIEDDEPASPGQKPSKYSQNSLPQDDSYYRRSPSSPPKIGVPATSGSASESNDGADGSPAGLSSSPNKSSPDSPQQPGTSKPLEAKISTWSQGSTPGTPVGLDKKAMRLLQRAPLLASPRTITANAKAFQAWLDETHPGLRGKVARDEIIEVKGEWDDAQHTLHAFGLPCTRVSENKLGNLKLDKAKIIVVNCAGELSNDAIINLRRFVEMGGYLLTTDWALSGVVQRAFPGYVEWNGGYTEDTLVDAVAVDTEDAELFANTPPSAYWKLVKKSQLVKISRWGSVHVLARSRMLMREDPSGYGILAFLMEHGRGQVLHLVGHFDNNADMAFNTKLPDPAPGLNLSFRQAIAANFIARALGGIAPAAAAASAQELGSGEDEHPQPGD
jgi:hypothetical protein